MKTINAKAVFIEGKPGKLTFQLSGRHLEEARQSGIKLNQAVELKVSDVNESKTAKQNNTFHDLLMIYWKSGLPSDKSLDLLKIRIKHTYGIRGHKEIICGEAYLYLKSWSLYTLKDGQQAIDGLISEMITQGVNENKFQDMLIMWNEYKTGIVKPVEKEELEIF